ncbi:S41 family peptidase [Tumebacillus permanentifrigoris]|uniref:Peptidase S41-like protein n=1 Tax=Tumebacillus permanentifrigoris TaxID=378543 RepID=A0A316DAY1_9BACL|nr:S41 family peptidase [Tumebacillus permanentifrigoris]PWK14488.1 peptidase S41-like protein [Tumebacillus permanentifrigoris]
MEQMRGWETMVEALAEQLTASYVFPQVGAAMAEAVRRKWLAGGYRHVESAVGLAEQLTDDLRNISRDLHVKVFYSEELIAHDDGEQLPYWQGAEAVNFGFAKVERLTGNVGYLKLDAFLPPERAGETLGGALAFLAHTEAMILDLRENRGGEPGMVQLLCSYFLAAQPVLLNTIYARETDTTRQFWSLPVLPGRRYLDKPVYILTSRMTFSAAEEFSYNLQHLQRATLVGEVTRGGANPGKVFRLQDHFRVFIPTQRSINPITQSNWEGTGVTPDVQLPAAEALAWAHREAVQAIVAKVEADPEHYPYGRFRNEVRELKATLN